MNISEYLLREGKDDDVAIVEGTGERTYADLRKAAARVAGELRAVGFEPGARIGILGQNSLFWVSAYLGIMRAGMTAVPFSPATVPAELDRCSRWVGLSAVFMDRRYAKVAVPAFGPGVRVFHEDLIGSEGPSSWEDGGEAFDAALMFTSGTTSKPKAVRVTHANLRANTASIVEYLGLRRSDRILTILPYYYCFGLSTLHTHLRVGGSVALCNSFAFPETAIDMMERTECTGFAGVPSSYQLLLRISSFSKRPLPKLRLLQQAGGKLHDVLIRELKAAKPDAAVFVMYGQTEATARLSYLPPELVLSKLGSIGRGIPGVSLSVVSEDGRPIKPGEVGEIFARGENVSPGYYGDPENTALKFVDGALRTGDLATVDEDGYIYVVDRKDDFIKSWGYRVSSQEVESCALEMPDLVSAAAVGVPDLEAGEAIRLFVTVRPGATVEGSAVQDHCRARLAKHMVPAAVEIIKALPLNANGKVVKAELRRMAAQ